MSDFKPRPGTFLPYMEYRNREKLAQRQPASPLTLLEILTRQTQQALPLFELQTQSGMDPSRYAAALKSLRDPGYIAIDGEALEQVVRLTEGGAQVLQLARPA
jgi:DNA-binding IclR family transcriptional regulator